MTKINLDDYFQTSNLLKEAKPLDSPEDIARAEEINRHMREVVRDYKHREALSWKKARGFIFCNNRVRS